MNSDASLYADHSYSAMNAQQTANFTNKSSASSSEGPKGSQKNSKTDPTALIANVKDVQERKRALTLDFSDPKSIRKTLDTQEVLQFLGISSPDFERLLSQNVAVVSQTPTPTQFFYPKNVTAEQEQYARGFIDALNQIHQMRGFVPMSNLLSPGFVSTTLAQADKEDAKRNEYLLGAFQEQLLARTATSLCNVVCSSNSNSSATITPFPASGVAKNSNSSASGDGAAPSTTSGSNSTSTVSSACSTVSTSLSSSSFCAPLHQPKHYQQQKSGKGPSPAGHWKHHSKGPPSNSISTASSVVPGADVLVKSNGTVPCSSGSSTSSNSSTSGSSSKPLVKSEAMEYPMAYDFDGNYLKTEGDFFAAAASGGSSSMHSSVPSSMVGMSHNLLLSGTVVGGNGGSGDGSVGGVLQQPQQQPQQQQPQSASSTANCYMADVRTRGPQGAVKLEGAAVPGEVLCSPAVFASGISPIDPDVQERIKLERKRARNRIAATKCRRRKIEKINELEGRVREVTEHNHSLAQRLCALRTEVNRLRFAVQKHRMNGCKFGDELVCTETGKKAMTAGT